MQYISILLFSLFVMTNLQAKGIEFFHGTWAEALELAKSEEKPIFVDCFTTWCGPCKRMAKNVFTQSEVGSFYNENYINVKLDMETKDGRKFGSKYPVSAYPTLYFVDAEGEVLHKIKGGQKADQLLKMGKFVLGKVDYSADYAKLYEDGNREPELIYNYVKALNKSNKSSVKVANEYIRSQKSLDDEFNQRFIFEAATESDSKIFKLLIENRKSIEKFVGEQEVKEKIEKACNKTVAKAIEFESEDLLIEAQKNMSSNYSEKSREFAAISNLDFHKSLGNSAAYRKCCKDYVKKQIGADTEELHKLAKSLIESFGHDADALKDAEKYAKKAAENDDNYKFQMTYASILYKNGKKGESIKAAQKALEMTDENKGAKNSIEQFIKKAKQG